MKNKFLISFIALIVFFNFTIPSYVLAAPTGNSKGFSRNIEPMPSVKEEAVSGSMKTEPSGDLLPLSQYPTSSISSDLPKYILPNTQESGSEVPDPNNDSTTTGTTYYVDINAPPGGSGTQSAPFNTIQAGINAVSQDGDVVQVAPGTYPDFVFVSDNVNHTDYSFTLRGSPSDPSLTIIQNNMSLVMSYASNKYFVLNGFTLEGNAGGSDVDLAVTIKNTVFHNIPYNFLTPFFLVGYESSPYTAPIVLEDVTIKDNVIQSEALRFQYCSNVLMNRVKIVNNVKPSSASTGGGAMSAYASNIAMVNSLVALNQGYSNCGFSSKAGGITIGGGTTTIVNSVIANNVSLASTPYSAIDAPGLNLFNQASVFLLNSIVWGNSYLNFPSFNNRQITLFSATISTAYSDIQYGVNGIYNSYGGTINWLTGNIGENMTLHDPQFFNINDWQNDGFSLLSTSPCAGTGISQFAFPGGPMVSAPTADINNDPRPIPTGTQPDMGAYEVNQDSTIYYVSTTGSNSNDGMTPQTAFATIAYAMGVVTEGDVIQVLPGTHSGDIINPIYQNNPVSVTILGSPNDPSQTKFNSPTNSPILGNNTHLIMNGFMYQGLSIQGVTSQTQLFKFVETAYTDTFELKNIIFQDNNINEGCVLHIFGGNNVILNKVKMINNTTTSAPLIIDSGANNVLADGLEIVGNQPYSSTSSGGGGIAIFGASAVVKNSLIAFNSGRNGYCGSVEISTGVNVVNGILKLINSTVAENVSLSSTQGVSGINIYNASQASVLNSIVWGNRSSLFPNYLKQINVSAVGPVSIAYSDIEFGQSGVSGGFNWLAGNIGENTTLHDPQFVNINNWVNNGFSLQNTSSCAGTGISTFTFPNNLVVAAPATDIINNPRPAPVGTQPDMGAYEIEQTVPPTTYTVSGTVLDAALNPITGAMINNQAVNPDGSYTFTVNYGSNLTVTPSATGYSFTPPSATFNNITSNQIQNFIGTMIYFDITGIVKTTTGPGVGFVINVVNNNPNLPSVTSTTTQADGSYSLSVPYGWDGVVKPIKQGYIVIDPSSGVRTYSNVTASQTEQHYKATLEKYTISGVVIMADGSGPLAGVELKDQSSNVVYAVTAADGAYSFEKEYGWSATVVPTKTNYSFDPIERVYANLQGPQDHQDYKAKKTSVVISGRVVSSPNDTVVAGVVLKDDTGTVVATTDARGLYSFEKPIGWSGLITPSKPKYAFTPKQRKYRNVQTNISEQNYLATMEIISHH